MSGGFTFPPPSPPPPKPTAGQQQQQSYDPSFRGRGRGRGSGGNSGDGSFRGGSSQRGRGGLQNDPTYPPRTAAGHKRKLDALRDPKPPTVKPGVQTAPAVPSFGAPILPVKPTAKPTSAPPPRKGLGLVPVGNDAAYSDSESEEEEDVDEEAVLFALGDKLTFEHNGVVMSLQSQADLVAWKKERRKNWPTDARVAEKYDEKRRIGEERRRLLEATEQLLGPSNGHEATPRRQKGDGEAHGRVGGAEVVRPAMPQTKEAATTSPVLATKHKFSTTEELAELRRKALMSMTSKSATKGTADGDGKSLAQSPKPESGRSGGEQVDAKLINYSESDTDVSSSQVSSDGSSDSDSGVSAPEEVSAKPAAMESSGQEAPLCRYFKASGYCRHGDACRFRHVPQPHHQKLAERREEKREKKTRPEKLEQQEEVGRKTIRQRLLEQQEGEEDLLALQVVKYLGKVGFFKVEEAVRDD